MSFSLCDDPETQGKYTLFVEFESSLDSWYRMCPIVQNSSREGRGCTEILQVTEDVRTGTSRKYVVTVKPRVTSDTPASLRNLRTTVPPVYIVLIRFLDGVSRGTGFFSRITLLRPFKGLFVVMNQPTTPNICPSPT